MVGLLALHQEYLWFDSPVVTDILLNALLGVWLLLVTPTVSPRPPGLAPYLFLQIFIELYLKQSK